MRQMHLEALDIFLRLCAAGLLGAVIGFERRVHHKAIGIAGMMLISIGSTTYMLLGRHLAEIDPAAVSRTLQGFLSGIGFLGGAVIFKSGFDVKGIKAAAAIWITGGSGAGDRDILLAARSGGWRSHGDHPLRCGQLSRRSPRRKARTIRSVVLRATITVLQWRGRAQASFHTADATEGWRSSSFIPAARSG